MCCQLHHRVVWKNARSGLSGPARRSAPETRLGNSRKRSPGRPRGACPTVEGRGPTVVRRPWGWSGLAFRRAHPSREAANYSNAYPEVNAASPGDNYLKNMNLWLAVPTGPAPAPATFLASLPTPQTARDGTSISVNREPVKPEIFGSRHIFMPRRGFLGQLGRREGSAGAPPRGADRFRRMDHQGR